MSRKFYVLDQSLGRPPLHISVPQPTWQAQAERYAGQPAWNVVNYDVPAPWGVWRVVAEFTGVDDEASPDPTLYRVSVAYVADRSEAATGDVVKVFGERTWRAAEGTARATAEKIERAIERGQDPTFDGRTHKAEPARNVTVEDYAKVVSRVKRLVALAGRTLNPNEMERKAAARKASEYLTAHPTPIRWLVPPGTQVRVVETKHLAAGLGKAKAHLKTSTARGPNWFFEAQRVQGEQSAEALNAGWLQFERHGYTVFVPAGEVEVHL